MLRKTLVALAAAVMLCTALVSTEASAWYGGWYGRSSGYPYGVWNGNGGVFPTGIAEDTFIPERTLTEGRSPTQDVIP